ncbi:hypothetical protein T05_14071, partial [Trichinella murrelli]
MLMAQRRRRTLLRHRWPGWKKVIVKAFRKTIQVWSRRNIGNHDINLEADLTDWAESILPHSQNICLESALTACTDPADIFTIFNDITAQVENWAKMNICH